MSPRLQLNITWFVMDGGREQTVAACILPAYSVESVLNTTCLPFPERYTVNSMSEFFLLQKR